MYQAWAGPRGNRAQSRSRSGSRAAMCPSAPPNVEASPSNAGADRVVWSPARMRSAARFAWALIAPRPPCPPGNCSGATRRLSCSTPSPLTSRCAVRPAPAPAPVCCHSRCTFFISSCEMQSRVMTPSDPQPVFQVRLLTRPIARGSSFGGWRWLSQLQMHGQTGPQRPWKNAPPPSAA